MMSGNVGIMIHDTYMVYELYGFTPCDGQCEQQAFRLTF